MQFAPRFLIERKRDGQRHANDEIRALVQGVTDGSMSDSQVGAWLMAALLQGLDREETIALTAAMRDSGERLDLSGIVRPKVDKHSTGGVGDKVSIPLAPLVAACGLAVPMISGRGLGHTGGTLDKLESIPGLRTDLSPAEVADQVDRLGVAMAGQTAALVPADQRLYRIRDVTGTVESPALVVASILSKKLAEGLDGLVLDVKFGRGAFFQDSTQARALAEALVDVAKGLGVPTRARLTAMEEPLGRAVGNAVEVMESLAVLRGEGPEDLRQLTLCLGAEMLQLGGLAATEEEARDNLTEALESGMAIRLAGHLIEAQGGDPRVIDDPRRLPQPVLTRDVRYVGTSPGWVHALDARGVAEAALKLGAGRQTEFDRIDPAAGLWNLVKRGEPLLPGQRVATLGAADEGKLQAGETALLEALQVEPVPCAARVLLGDRIV